MADKIIITRIFEAPVEKVWKAWTTPELVQKWWGPKEFTAPSIKIDLRVDGQYIYCMRGPAGTEFDRDLYSAGIYKEIVPNEKIVATDYFSDSEGNKSTPTDHGLSSEMPSEMEVTVLFEEVGEGKTKVSIIYSPENDKQRQVMIETRMEEGWGTSLDKLAEVVGN